jgi:hypothetical protein
VQNTPKSAKIDPKMAKMGVILEICGEIIPKMGFILQKIQINASIALVTKIF